MNTTCLTILVLLASVAIAAHPQIKLNPAKVTEKEASEVFLCLCRIICDAREPLQLKRIIVEAGPKAQNYTVIWLSDIYGIPYAENDAYWESYPSVVCDKNYDERRDAFKLLMGRFASFYVEVCELEPDIEECEKCDDTMMEFEKVIQEFTLKGVCFNPKTTAGNVASDMEMG